MTPASQGGALILAHSGIFPGRSAYGRIASKCHAFWNFETLREIIRSFQGGLEGFLAGRPGTLAAFSDAKKGEGMAKQTKVTIETDSLLIVRGGNSTRAWCSQCGAEVEVIALENTGVVSNLERPALEEWLNSVELHRTLTVDGSSLICLNSLLARVQNTKMR